MNAKTGISLLHNTATLLALHGANPFQVKYYSYAARFLEQLGQDYMHLPLDVLRPIPGMTKSILELVRELQETGSLKRWEALQAQTPASILTLLSLPGLGPQKVRTLWQQLGVIDIPSLLSACEKGLVAQLPGFAKKTQTAIIESIKQKEKYNQLCLYAQIASSAKDLLNAIKKNFSTIQVHITGELRRKNPVISEATLLIGSNDIAPIWQWLNQQNWLHSNEELQQVENVWHGNFVAWPLLPLLIHFCTPDQFYRQLVLQTGSEDHLAWAFHIHTEHHSSAPYTLPENYSSCQTELAIYQKAKLPYIPPPLREGRFEERWIQEGTPKLIGKTDIKGILHVHTNYSDGKDSLVNMAMYCKAKGYAYIGITDHSQSAAYAGGMKMDKIKRQHEEIDQLNHKLAPFYIFKGIEVDILPDGSLDYATEILAHFDFVIASIHMGLKMPTSKATARLLNAIKNPFTTMIGHPTGRLLLKREGYTIDHEVIIEACAQHGVVIEINASPWRLDLDWQWISHALAKQVLLSINPDAHQQEELQNIIYGIYMGKKGGLTPQHTFNTMSLEKIKNYLHARKLRALAS